MIERNKKGKLTYKNYILNAMKYSILRETKATGLLSCLYTISLFFKC